MSLDGTWELLFEATKEKRVEDAWTRWSLIPPFETPSTGASQVCIYATSAKLALTRYRVAGTIAKYPSAPWGPVLVQPQKIWFAENTLIEFSSAISSAPLIIQPARRLNDLSVKIWHRIA